MKRFQILLIAVLAVAALWGTGWFYVAGLIKDEAQYLAQADGVTAPRIECESFDVAGFPFQFAPICTNARVTSADLTLTIPEVRATALFYRPTHLQIFAASPARLSDAFTGSAHELAWENLRASLRLDGNRIARLSMISDNLVQSDALFGSMELGRAERLEIHLVDATESTAPETGGQTLDFFARLDGTTIEGFDITNGAASLDGRLTGVPAPDLLSHPKVLRLWQMADGVLTLRNLEAFADGLTLKAEGEARLDEEGRVNASLAVTSNGLVERFPGLAEDPVATMFLGTANIEGAYSQNLSVRGGTLYVGILPIMALQPLF